jgi:N-acetylmuramoyl-L-alanine amidase
MLMSKTLVIILDAGHGMGNRNVGKFDPGAVVNGVREADIAMEWVNELREQALALGHRVVRTRKDNEDPASIASRAVTARQYGGDIMLSIHCNWSSNPATRGAETFYRGSANKAKSAAIAKSVSDVLGGTNRGAKLESESQHGKLAIMRFQPCFLLELGFLTNLQDRISMRNAIIRKQACEKILNELLKGLT